jgi:hypothetical protein
VRLTASVIEHSLCRLSRLKTDKLFLVQGHGALDSSNNSQVEKHKRSSTFTPRKEKKTPLSESRILVSLWQTPFLVLAKEIKDAGLRSSAPLRRVLGRSVVMY